MVQEKNVAGFGRTLIVLPAHNEAAAIKAVLQDLQSTVAADVLVVSDASQDDTAATARRHGTQVIELSQQIGAWGATQTGMRFALRHGYWVAAAMDADGQHDARSLQSLLQARDATGADVVIGTFPQRISASKRLAWSWFRALTGLGIEDLTSGLRVYGPRALEVLASPDATLLDYQDVGVLLMLRQHGLTMLEVPVTMHARQEGKSRVFASWPRVARYMAQTTVLCVARIGARRISLFRATAG